MAEGRSLADMVAMSADELQESFDETSVDYTVDLERALIFCASRGLRKHVRVILVAWTQRTGVFSWNRILEKALLFGDCSMVEDVLEALIPKCGGLNQRDVSGRYLAMELVYYPRLINCLPKLVQLRLDFDMQDPLTGKSGLLEAARCGNVDMMGEMLDLGADPTLTRSKPLLNVLHLLAGGGRQDLDQEEANALVSRLHKCGIAADAVAHLGYLDTFGMREMFKQDFAKGAGYYAIQKKAGLRDVGQYYDSLVGCTPLMIAAGASNGAMIQALLQVGCSVNCQPVCSEGTDCMHVYPTTAAHVCTMNCANDCWSVDSLASLIEAGGCVNALDGCGKIPLCYAVMASNSSATKFLLEANSDLHIVDECKAANLMEAALENPLPGFHRVLVKAGFPYRVLLKVVEKLDAVHALYVDHTNRGARVASTLLGLLVTPWDTQHLEQIYVGLSARDWQWLQAQAHNPSSLAQICRVTVRRSMNSGAMFLADIEQLPIPPRLKDFLLLRDEEDWNSRYQNLSVSCD